MQQFLSEDVFYFSYDFDLTHSMQKQSEPDYDSSKVRTVVDVPHFSLAFVEAVLWAFLLEP